MSELPLMPKATAMWLLENTGLTFEQIADFCGMHTIEIQAMADEEVGVGLIGIDPVANKQVSLENIQECEKDPSKRLTLCMETIAAVKKNQKGKRYTPMKSRQARPDAIAWLLKHYPKMSDAQIAKLVRTTKATIESVRNRTHRHAAHIKPHDPVLLGICSQTELNEAVAKLEKNKEIETAEA